MESFLTAIERALIAENYTAALIISLAVPDICGKLEGKTISSARYIDWFSIYLGAKYKGYLSGDDCYALRCAILHEASDDISTQRNRDILDKFYFITKGVHCNRFSGVHFGDPRFDGKEVLQISVHDFCKDMVTATRQWLSTTSNNDVVKENIRSMVIVHEAGEGIGFIKFVQ